MGKMRIIFGRINLLQIMAIREEGTPGLALLLAIKDTNGATVWVMRTMLIAYLPTMIIIETNENFLATW